MQRTHRTYHWTPCFPDFYPGQSLPGCSSTGPADGLLSSPAPPSSPASCWSMSGCLRARLAAVLGGRCQGLLVPSGPHPRVERNVDAQALAYLRGEMREQNPWRWGWHHILILRQSQPPCVPGTLTQEFGHCIVMFPSPQGFDYLHRVHPAITSRTVSSGAWGAALQP